LKSKNITHSAAVSFVMIVLFTFGALFLYNLVNSRKGLDIQLPVDSNITTAIGQANRNELPSRTFREIEITPDNVVSVIETLNRPDAYILHAVIEINGMGKSSSTSLTHSVRNGMSADVSETDGHIFHSVRANGQVYVWKDNGEAVLTPDFGEDAAAGIAAYEAIFDIAPENILSTGYEAFDGFFCIRFSVCDPELALITDYLIDTDSGLLVSSETRDDSGIVLYRMNTLSIERDTPSDDVFLLPDGSMPG